MKGRIRIDWTGPRGFQVRAGDGDLDWTVEVGSTPVTLFNAVRSALPTRAVLEDSFDCLLVNARHVKQVPSRKTDVKDGTTVAVVRTLGG